MIWPFGKIMLDFSHALTQSPLEKPMRNVGRIKLGYYPLPEAEGTRLRNLLKYPSEMVSVLDPCVGTGAALMQLTEGSLVSRYGVERDADRATAAKDAGIETVHGNVFDGQAKVESFSLLYLNPPYDSEIGSMDNKRMEYLFLEHTYRWLVYGGVLLMVVPQERLHACAQLLAANFTSFNVFTLTGREIRSFRPSRIHRVSSHHQGSFVRSCYRQLAFSSRIALGSELWRLSSPHRRHFGGEVLTPLESGDCCLHSR